MYLFGQLDIEKVWHNLVLPFTDIFDIPCIVEHVQLLHVLVAIELFFTNIEFLQDNC